MLVALPEGPIPAIPDIAETGTYDPAPEGPFGPSWSGNYRLWFFVSMFGFTSMFCDEISALEPAANAFIIG